MGHIHESHGRVTVEERRLESFVVHMSYGYDETGNVHSDELGTFGILWRSSPHPEFLFDDLDDLIAALVDLKASRG